MEISTGLIRHRLLICQVKFISTCWRGYNSATACEKSNRDQGSIQLSPGPGLI